MQSFLLNFHKTSAIVCIALFSFTSIPTLAQTTTTYSYDGKGRMVSAERSDGKDLSIGFDDANNIKSANQGSGGAGGGSNSPPICQDETGLAINGLYLSSVAQSCSDIDGDDVLATNVTDPVGQGSASITSNGETIGFNSLPAGNTSVVVTVSDGHGGSATYNVTVYYDGGSGGCTGIECP